MFLVTYAQSYLNRNDEQDETKEFFQYPNNEVHSYDNLNNVNSSIV